MAILLQMTDDNSGLRLPIDKQRLTIGRNTDNDISLDDELVSKQHAVIEVVVRGNENNHIVEFYIQDLESTNRTYVNDQPISLHRLRNDDVISIGMNNFKFIDEAQDALDETAQLYKTWIPGVYYTGKKDKKKKGKK